MNVKLFEGMNSIKNVLNSNKYKYDLVAKIVTNNIESCSEIEHEI